VLDLQLTRYGRQLLSRGRFKPVYYCFSDDEVIYDHRWVSGTIGAEQQWEVEGRIQTDTPRIKTINSKTNAEVSVFNASDGAITDQIITDLYNLGPGLQDQVYLAELTSGKIVVDVDFADSEKLLQYFLGTKRYFTDKAPAWNVLFYKSPLASSSAFYSKTNITAAVPQLNVTLTDVFYRLSSQQNVFTLHPHLQDIINRLNKYLSIDDVEELSDSEQLGLNLNNVLTSEVEGEYYDNYFDERMLADGSKVFIEKDFLFISVEEANVDFTKDNFMLEIYEVMESAPEENIEQLNKLVFYGPSGISMGANGPHPQAVETYFAVELDVDINKAIACSLINSETILGGFLKTKNIYNTQVFDCSGLALDTDYVSTSPYDDLSDVTPEEAC